MVNLKWRSGRKIVTWKNNNATIEKATPTKNYIWTPHFKLFEHQLKTKLFTSLGFTT